MTGCATDSSRRVRLLGVLFGMGLYAAVAQVLFLREMLVVFFGNELALATLLAAWLVGIGGGALAARLLLRRELSWRSTRAWMAGAMILAAILLPVQMVLIRTLRTILGVPPGELATFGGLATSALLVFLPSCLAVGLTFPLACASLKGADEGAPVSRVYAMESLGGMAGGILMTFLFVPHFSSVQVALAACLVLVAGAGLLADRRAIRLIAGVGGLVCLLVILAMPALLSGLDRRLTETRWRAFGVLGSPGGEGMAGARLVAWRDSVYQNLAVLESQGQYVLYGNGQVVFAFPDPVAAEHEVHFAMAQNPLARRVLVAGGNPLDILPEILKYPVERVVYVEIDPGIGAILGESVPEAYQAVFADARVCRVAEDTPRYIGRCREKFDIVLLNAPRPATAGANRHHTLEFFEAVRRVLAPGGFLCTAVESSERLQGEAVRMGATIHHALSRVFPVVRMTAETRNRFFAGDGRVPAPDGAGLTLDREILVGRSRGAGVETLYFRPEYFLGADELDPGKMTWVRERFEGCQVPPNSRLRPVAYFYSLQLWNRQTGSGLDRWLTGLGSMGGRWTMPGILLAGGLCLAVGWALSWQTGRRLVRASRAWSRAMAAGIILGTGACGMGMEILCLFLFQSLFGHVYAQLGFILALFMAGLAVGALAAQRMCENGPRAFLLWLGGIEAMLAILLLGLPALLGFSGSGGVESPSWVEWGLYALVGVTGGCVGAEFPLANRLFRDAGGGLGAAAAMTDVADHVGAALGCLAVGVVFLPVLGVGGACLLLAGLKAGGILMLAAAIPGLAKR